MAESPPVLPPELIKLMADLTDKIGNDIINRLQLQRDMVEANSPWKMLGHNAVIGATAFALSVLISDFADKALGADEERMKEIHRRVAVVVNELMAQHSRSKFSVIIELPKNEEAKEG